MSLKVLFGRIICLGGLALTVPVSADPLPSDIYAALPEADNVRMSPDGKAVAMITPIGPHLGVRVWRPDGPQDFFNPTGSDQLNWLAWKGDDHLLLSMRFTDDEAGKEVGATRLVFTSLSTKESTKVTFREPLPPPNVVIIGREGYQPPHVQDRVISLLPQDPDHILLAASTGQWIHPEAMMVDIHRGLPRTMLHPTGGVVKWYADAEGVVRLCQLLGSANGRQTSLIFRVRDDVTSDWRVIHRGDADEGARFIPLAFSRQSPTILYILADQENGRLALQAFDTRTLTAGPPLAADPQCDIEPVLRDNQLLGYIDSCRSQTEVYFDSSWQQDQAILQRALKTEQVALIDRTADGKFALVRSELTAYSPSSFWYFDQSGPQKTLTKLADSYSRLGPNQIAPVRQVSFTARDGLTIPALLTLPPGSAAGNAPGPLGFVVLPHGGPTARDQLEFDWISQFIASRGYGVLQPQFRGSTGYGVAFQRAGYRQWGGKMQDDVTDATTWLIDQRLADPKRICIMGMSYGGYAALMGAALRPDLYQCAAAVAPVTDLDRLLHDRNRNEFGDINRDRIIGDQDVAFGQSPIDQAPRIVAPVLLIHGRKDFTVPVEHSEDMESSLKKAGKRVQAIYLDNADHFFTRADDRAVCLRALGAFLTGALGSGDRSPGS